MAIGKDVWDGLKGTVLLNERDGHVAEQVTGMAVDMRDRDKRLIRVETTLELLTRELLTRELHRAGRAALAAAPAWAGGRLRRVIRVMSPQYS